MEMAMITFPASNKKTFTRSMIASPTFFHLGERYGGSSMMIKLRSLDLIRYLITNAALIAARNPMRYRNIKTTPCILKNPNFLSAGITSEMSSAYTGRRAEQLISGVTMMVINLSFQLLMVRVLMMAGTAQATPLKRRIR